MAKPDWITLGTTTGQGDGTFTVTAPSDYKGREQRSGTVTVNGTGVSPVDFMVIQAGIGVDIEYNSQSGGAVSVGKDGGTVTISGNANAAALGFRLKNDENVTGSSVQMLFDASESIDDGDAYEVDGYTAQTITLPNTWSCNGGTTVNNQASIPADPGKNGMYLFQITLSFEKNESAYDQIIYLEVMDYPSATKSLTYKITQTHSDAFLYIYDENGDDLNGGSLSFEATGGTKTVTVDSNTTWYPA